jgi:GNAT superfamily N-acetyltransferase
MNSTIRQTGELSATERAAIYGEEADPFGVTDLGLEWRPKEIHFILELAGRPVAHAGVLRHEVRSTNSSVHLAGLGAVITAEEARGHGHATALIQHAIGHVVEAWGVDALMLFCLRGLVPFYRRQGFRLVRARVIIDQPTRRLLSPLPVMVRSLNDRIWPEEDVTLGSLPW